LFDLSTAADFIGKEIVRCISLAEDGIHAILLVFSVRRLAEEEKIMLSFLQALFLLVAMSWKRMRRDIGGVFG